MRSPFICVLIALLAGLSAAPLHAGLIVNGGFESGLAGWSRTDQLGSEGTFFVQTGTATPVLGTTVPAPPEGSNATMTDAEGPGTHVLYQDVFIPTGVQSAILTFSLLLRNSADQYYTPETLDFSTPALNQQFRVDFLRPTADVFSVAPADIVFNAYRTQETDPLSLGYTTITVDITSLLQANPNETLRLRLAQADNVNIFNTGVDAVDITVNPIPEPATWTLLSGSLALAALLRRRLPS